MIFSDFYKSPRSPLSKFRHPTIQLPTPLPTDAPDWVAEEYADLLSRDKAKQKDAVKRYLAAKVKNDWEFPWPSRVVEEAVRDGIDERLAKEAVQEAITKDSEPVHDGTKEDDGYQVDSESDDDDAESVYSTISEDPIHYRPRAEWTSDLSDNDDDSLTTPSSPYRFDNPDSVGTTIKASIISKRAKRRRAVRKEMEWNEGLACFEARRNAWTGARTVRIRSKPVTPPAVSPRSPRRFFFRRSMSGSGSPPPPMSSLHPTQPMTSGDGSDASSVARSDGTDLRKSQTKDTTPSTTPSAKDCPVETLLPLAPPLLPPNNPLRASITPSVYLSLYEKLIIHNLQPSCPINLSDMLRACVSGWKRDGEWPPRPTPAELPVTARKKKTNNTKTSQDGSASGGTKDNLRRMSFGLLGGDKGDKNGAAKGIRQSLSRALGIGAIGVHDYSPAVERV